MRSICSNAATRLEIIGGRCLLLCRFPLLLPLFLLAAGGGLIFDDLFEVEVAPAVLLTVVHREQGQLRLMTHRQTDTRAINVLRLTSSDPVKIRSLKRYGTSHEV